MNRIVANLFLGDTTDAIRFGFPMEPIQGTLDLTGWDAEKEINANDFSTVKQAIEIIDSYLSKHHPLLVFCHAGMDRSPFVVACYLLKEYDNMTPTIAYGDVKRVHPQTMIHDDWMRKYQTSLAKVVSS